MFPLIGKFALLLSAATYLCGGTLANAQDSITAEYRAVVTERAGKIVEGMGIEDGELRSRVQTHIANYYCTLQSYQDQVAAMSEEEATAAATRIAEERWASHIRFVAVLSAELPAEQVEKVKDGLTYGVVNHTYNAYLKQYPNLKEEDKRQIKALLIEAREYAMDGNSSDEKHRWFRKYKGKISNYLSTAGY